MRRFLASLLLALCAAHSAWSQSSCSSDAQPTPATLLERFMSADCEACWGAPHPLRLDPRTLSIDWIAPGAVGADAPLSAAVSRDAAMRLAELGLEAPETSLDSRTKVKRKPLVQLRVAHGKALGGYIGATIELRAGARARLRKPLNAWLLLVETLPAGVEGTPVARNLVRNTLFLAWNQPDRVLKDGRQVFRELRPLNIPEGARPERLRVIGWVQDADGRVLSAAQSVCPPAMAAQ